MATFKTIGPAPEVEIVNVAEAVYDDIVTLAEKLGERLGFHVTHSQAIAWMLKATVSLVPQPVALSVDAKLELIAPELEALMAKGEKIPAIRRAREVSGMGLKDAKEYVERRWQALCDAYRGVQS